MTNRSETEIQELYEQLLKLADKEEQALIAENLEELEACAYRKEEIITKVCASEGGLAGHAPLRYREELAVLLAEVAKRHEQSTRQIQAMRDECRRGVLRIQNGRRAHRAYHHARQQGPESSARLM